MTPRQKDDGTYVVVDGNEIVIAGPFYSHREAYRWIDRQEGEPINRSEKVSDYFLSQRGLA
jgi:hypothetical protein